ncbi:MAG: hypothetical protein HY077_16760 [Elusimicrobia bacterium]|nr:hypothetical protein [Elusimicrobiota bacterium]
MMSLPASFLFALAALPAFVPRPAQADSRAQRYYYEEIFEPFFVPDKDHPGTYRADRRGSVPSSFLAAKPKDSFRVFVIGGSIASLLSTDPGGGNIGPSFSAALPSLKVEVLNCGMAGYDSYREALVEREILEYAPDLIVLLAGHNEGLASPPVPVWLLKTKEALASLSSYRALAKKLALTQWPDRDSTAEGYRRRDETFSKNLAASLEHAKLRGVPVAVVVPPRDYREPLESDQTFYDPAFVGGYVQFLRGDYRSALKAWKKSLEALEKDKAGRLEAKSFTLGFIARSEEKLGLWEDARRDFMEAAAADRAAICGPACQGIIRKAAAEQGALLVEADRMFQEKTFPRLPGLETFNDRMHWKSRFNCLMSAEIIATLRKDPRLGRLPWDDASLKALAESCASPGTPSTAEDDDRKKLGYVLMALSWPHFEHLSPVAVFYLEAIRQDRPDWLLDVPGLIGKTENPLLNSLYGLEMETPKTLLPRLYWHVGEMRLLEGKFGEAAEDFSQALRLDPASPWPRVSLAAAEGLSGRKDLALRELKEAAARSLNDAQRDRLRESAIALASGLGLGAPRELTATDVKFLTDEAVKAISASDRGAALSALDRAAAQSPRPPELRYIAQLYRRLHAAEKFLKMSDSLRTLYPDDAELWLDRAEAETETGRKEGALASLARARALKPGAAELRRIERLEETLKAGPPLQGRDYSSSDKPADFQPDKDSKPDAHDVPDSAPAPAPAPRP